RARPARPDPHRCHRPPRLSRIPSATFLQCVLHDGSELDDADSAEDGPTVDQECERAVDAEVVRLGDVALDVGVAPTRVDAPGDAELGRVAQQVVTAEGPLLLAEPLVIWPVLAVRAGAAPGLVRRAGQRVHGERAILEAQANPPVVFLENRRHRPLDGPAVW